MVVQGCEGGWGVESDQIQLNSYMKHIVVILFLQLEFNQIDLFIFERGFDGKLYSKQIFCCFFGEKYFSQMGQIN